MSVKTKFNAIRAKTAMLGQNVANYASGAVTGIRQGFNSGYSARPLPLVTHAQIASAKGATLKGWDVGFKLGRLAGQASRAIRDAGEFIWRGVQANIGKVGSVMTGFLGKMRVRLHQLARNVVRITQDVGQRVGAAVRNTAGYAKGYYEGSKFRPTHKAAYATGRAIGRMEGLRSGSNARLTGTAIAGGAGTVVGLYLGSRGRKEDRENG